MKVYRIDTVSSASKRITSMFIHEDSLTLAKHRAANLHYIDVRVIKVEQDTEENYRKWLFWEYEPNKSENARCLEE